MDEEMGREERQRALIAQVLSAYRRGESTLLRLSQDLQELLLELQWAPRDWLDSFQAEVNELEVLYAIALDRGLLHDLPAGYRTDVNETVCRVEALLERLPPMIGDENL